MLLCERQESHIYLDRLRSWSFYDSANVNGRDERRLTNCNASLKAAVTFPAPERFQFEHHDEFLALDKEATVTYEPSQTGEVTRYVADITKARDLLEYAPEVPLSLGIKKYIAWCRETGFI